MAGKGKITRQDVLDDKVLKVGKDYAKSLDPAIQRNKEWLESFEAIKKSALGYADIEKKFKVSKNRKEFLQIKKQEEDLRKKTAQALKAEQDALVKVQRVQQAKLDTDKKAVDLANKKLTLQAKEDRAKSRSIKLTQQEKTDLQILNRGKREAAKISSSLSTAYERESTRLIQLRRRYKDVALTQGESSKQAQNLRNQVQRLDARLKRVDASVGQFNRNVGNYRSAMAGAVGATRQLASALGLVGGAFLAVQVLRDAVNVIRDFEKQNASLAGILQVERDEMQGLINDSQRLGATTVKTAGQVTQLQIAYARLGFNQQEIIDLTEGTINGSIALNAELDRTANLTGAVINTFDDLNTSDASNVLDILALSTAKSALNFEKLETGLPIVAGAANAAGVPFTKLTALLGKLADSGIDVSTSATALRNIFIESSAQGLSYEQILDKIKNNTDKLTASNDEFGKRAAVSASILANNIDKTNELDQSLQNAAGTAESMANKELDTLDGSLKLLRSAFEGYILSINESSGASLSLKSIIKTLADNFGSIVGFVINATKAYVAYRIIVRLSRLQTSLMNVSLVNTRKASLAAAKGISRTQLAFVKFNRVLKANALGIAVTAITAAILLFDKYAKTLDEVADETNEVTTNFIKQKRESQSLNNEISGMVDRYDELKSKTELNKDEQAELNSIIQKLVKNVPDAVNEFDEYGNAIGVNTAKIREFTSASRDLLSQQNATALKENRDLLEQLTEKQESLNKVNEEGNVINIEGVGLITKRDGVLQRATRRSGKYGNSLRVTNDLTSEEIKLVSEAISKNRENIKQTEDNIAALGGEKSERILAAEASQRQAEESKKLAEQKAQEIKTVENLKSKISDLKQEQEQLTIADKSRSSEINALIASYQKEIDAILGVSSANKSASDAQKERLDAQKKIAEDAFKLEEFSIKQRIKLKQDFANDDSNLFDERKKAIQDVSNLEIELATLNAERKLELTEKFTSDEINQILTNGEIANSTVKKITDEERLIIEKHQAQLNQIKGNRESGEDNLEAERLIANAEIEKAIREKALNEELIAENNAFKAKEGIYENEVDAVELRERRIAEIKKRFALEALNEQVKAIESLLESEELSANKRAEFERKLASIKLEISNLTTEDFLANNEREIASTENKAVEILAITRDLSNAIGNLADAIFESRISKVDDEIAKNEEFYERQLELASNDEEQKRILEEEAEKRRQELELKKRKEQRKQAILAKALAAFQVGLNTATAIIGALAPPPVGLGPIAGIPISIATGVIGAVQLAAVLAKPIPKYATGTKNHKGGLAEVAELRPEVIEEPGKAPYIQRQRAILDLPKGTVVTPSVGEYDRLMRASILSSVDIDNKRLNSFQSERVFDDYSQEMIEEMRLTRKAFENKKTNIHIHEREMSFDDAVRRLNILKWG